MQKNEPQKKALWIGVKVTELTRVPWYGLNDLGDRPTLPGIMYHTIRQSRHPSGNGFHHYFPELLNMATVAPNGGVYTKEDLAVCALLGARARVELLEETFLDKQIQLSSSSPFVPGIGETAFPIQDVAAAQEYAKGRQFPIP